MQNLNKIDLLNSIKEYRNKVSDSRLKLGINMYLDNLFKDLNIKESKISIYYIQNNEIIIEYYKEFYSRPTISISEKISSILMGYGLTAYEIRTIILDYFNKKFNKDVTAMYIEIDNWNIFLKLYPNFFLN